MAKLTIERVRELFRFDSEIGVFTRRVTVANALAGSECHCIRKDGYEQISIDGVRYLSHRLAWFVTHGTWPVNGIDHMNGVRTDNRPANLREADHSENGQNQRRPKAHVGRTSRFLGVCRAKTSSARPWLSQIKAEGKNRFLGHYATEEEASEVYLAAKALLHPFQTIA